MNKNEKIFSNGKRSIAAILTLCLFLGITGTCVYAVAMPEETTATEETTQELVPVMTTRCAHTCNYTTRCNGKGNL